MTVFVDSTVLMYAAGREHPLKAGSTQVVTLVRDGGLDAVISAEVIQEILHRYAAIGHRERGADLAREALDVFAPVLAVTDSLMRRVPDLVDRYGKLPARDLVHVATCQEYGLSAVITADRDFDSVSEVTRIDPGDRERLQSHLG